MTDEMTRFKNVVGLSVSAIAAEHFFSAGMSSPWSVEKFATSPDDAAKVWSLFWKGTIASVIFAIVIGLMLKNGQAMIYSVGGAAAVAAFMGWEYYDALHGKL